jgi:hypothetical protein
MTTILELLLSKHLGRPRRSNGNGSSFWNCPSCDHRNFHTMPDIPAHKHRTRCWNDGCGFGGDIFDMLKFLRPYEDYGDRKLRVKNLTAELAKLKMTSTLAAGSSEEPKRA